MKKDIGTAVAVEIAGSDRLPRRPGIGAHGPAADQCVVAHLPDRDLAGARVLPQDVGVAAAKEIAGSDRFPSRPRIGAAGPPPIKLFPLISQIETWPLVVF